LPLSAPCPLFFLPLTATSTKQKQQQKKSASKDRYIIPFIPSTERTKATTTTATITTSTTKKWTTKQKKMHAQKAKTPSECSIRNQQTQKKTL
jgi:hypothetical protein